MRFALLDYQRTEPSPGLIGACPACSSVMVAKCGTQRVHHWAHKAERSCDPWWETETPWHRTWKSKFPYEWQEDVQYDPLGEKHIADVHTPHGLVIEFQHSHLRPEELAAREQFYRNMLWVVDGSRLKRDLPRFAGGTDSFRSILRPGLYLAPFPDEAFPRSWLSCSVPVLFDFENAADGAQEITRLKRPLWCLLPGRVHGRAVVLQVSRDSFVRWVHDRAQPVPTQAILRAVANALLIEHQRHVQEIQRATAMAARERQWWRRIPSRRF